MPEPLKNEVYDTLTEAFRFLDDVNNTYEHSFSLCGATRSFVFYLSLLSLGLAFIFSLLAPPLLTMIPILAMVALFFGRRLFFLSMQQRKLMSVMTNTRDNVLRLLVSSGFSLNQFPMSDSCYSFCIDRLDAIMKEG